jgi:hypothetical protein
MPRLLTLILFVLLFPAPALAMPGDPAGLYVGQQVWGTPACGQPHVETSTPAAYLAAHGTGLFDGDPEAWADESRCVIILNPQWTTHSAAKRCHVIVHEWGHLAGYRDPSNTADPEHSDNPRSVMYADDLIGESKVRIGKHRWRWEADSAFRPCVTMTQPGVQVG